jgi:tetratricopeptide (TPR) repeat protein
MKRLSLVSFVFIIVLVGAFSGCAKISAKKDLKEGTDLYEAKKYDDAIKKFTSAVHKDPTLHVAYIDLGLSYMALYVPGSTHPKDMAYVEESIKAFKKYQQLHPDDPKVNEYLITMYLNADRKEDAIKYFEEQLAKDNTNTAFMQKLAFLYAQTGKFDEALKWYQRRASVEPNNPEAYYIIGVICWEKSYRFADVTPEQRERLVSVGLDALQKAIRINPNYADAYLYMNLLYREKAKLIALTPDAVPEDKIDEYNGLLEKAKEYQQKAIALKQQAAASPS